MWWSLDFSGPYERDFFSSNYCELKKATEKLWWMKLRLIEKNCQPWRSASDFFNKSPIKSAWSHNRYYSCTFIVLYTYSVLIKSECRSRIQKYTLKNVYPSGGSSSNFSSVMFSCDGCTHYFSNLCDSKTSFIQMRLFSPTNLAPRWLRANQNASGSASEPVNLTE